jgi:hypothetical protein
MQVFSNLLLWKKYFPSGVIQQWACDSILAKAIVPGIEMAPDLATDITYYTRIADSIKDMIPDVYNTPSEFKFLQVSFLKQIFAKAENNPQYQNRYFCVHVECFTLKS